MKNTTTTLVDTRQEMLKINERQKDFYESRFESTKEEQPVAERAANLPTNIWTWMRYRLMDMGKSVKVYEQVYALHREFGVPFYLCWASTLRLHKPEQRQGR